MAALDGFWQVKDEQKQFYLKLNYLIKTDTQNIKMSEKENNTITNKQLGHVFYNKKYNNVPFLY